MKLKIFFQLKRCLFCLDKLNQLADISFGDCYIEGKSDFYGKSSVIVRTKKGESIFDKYSYLFDFKKQPIEQISMSQHLNKMNQNLEYAKIFMKESNIYADTMSDYKINSRIARRLSKACNQISWGKNYKFNKIRFSLFRSKILKSVLAGVVIGITFLKDIFIHRSKEINYCLKKPSRANIIITGGQLFNKGAQAMTFIVADQMSRKFPHKKIYLFSTQDFLSIDERKKVYKFRILPWDTTTKIRLLSFSNKLLKKYAYYYDLEDNIREIIKNANFFIDISGYALTSQWHWTASVDYLLNIMIAKKHSIPFYIFPQSIGPFVYPLQYRFLLYPLVALYLKYPAKIFARERDGITCLSKFTKKNVEKCYDIVLHAKEWNLSNIYNRRLHLKKIKICPNSVGIIPNLRVVERTTSDDIYSLYKLLINQLLNANKYVYILRHSYEDLDVCEKIRAPFLSDKRVKVIFDDLNAIELENIIKQFDFMIASRYHSIIHSYRNGIPALIIGWATKYFELSDDFDQLDYFFNIRENIDIDLIISKLDKLIKNYKYEKEKLTIRMNMLNKDNIFNIFNSDTA